MECAESCTSADSGDSSQPNFRLATRDHVSEGHNGQNTSNVILGEGGQENIQFLLMQV
jgi:hypothetical protein